MVEGVLVEISSVFSLIKSCISGILLSILKLFCGCLLKIGTYLIGWLPLTSTWKQWLDLRFVVSVHQLQLKGLKTSIRIRAYPAYYLPIKMTFSAGGGPRNLMLWILLLDPITRRLIDSRKFISWKWFSRTKCWKNGYYVQSISRRYFSADVRIDAVSELSGDLEKSESAFFFRLMSSFNINWFLVMQI